MTTLPYDKWSKKEQAELGKIHKEHLAKLKADAPVKAHYAAISEEYKRDHEAKLKADAPIKAKYAAISEEYKKKHLAHIKQYSSTASSRRSKM